MAQAVLEAANLNADTVIVAQAMGKATPRELLDFAWEQLDPADRQDFDIHAVQAPFSVRHAIRAIDLAGKARSTMLAALARRMPDEMKDQLDLMDLALASEVYRHLRTVFEISGVMPWDRPAMRETREKQIRAGITCRWNLARTWNPEAGS